MIDLPERTQILRWVEEAHEQGARRHEACQLLGIRLRTLQRWSDADGTLRTDGRARRTFEPPQQAQ